MDIGRSHHAERARRKNRSLSSINHLTLAPLTVRLPLRDGDNSDLLDLPPPLPRYPSSSYLQGKSAPTTPRLLSCSTTPLRSRCHRRMPSAPGDSSTYFLKSRSSSHLPTSSTFSGKMTPRRRRADGNYGDEGHGDSGWLLRAGALLSSEAREYKGQAWLVSRQSSTSLTGMRNNFDDDGSGAIADDDDDGQIGLFEEQMLARERTMASRRGSTSARTTSLSDDGDGSRALSEMRNYVDSPLLESGSAADEESYFSAGVGPDFVNLDERLEQLDGLHDISQDDEAAVRRLVRHGRPLGNKWWLSNVLGWSLFSVDEDDEEAEEGDEALDDDAQDVCASSSESSARRQSARRFEGPPAERVLPPPASDEGGWKDAAWLLSVASSVVF
ncbi:hypothetical protein CDD81_6257 [Ophiocordyceps australis]|uniref:Uncharacterized protein n=1 Tax=Ophiocordyceps australis TaxID=1399860 RepID=A0A2C5Y5Y3_9HYPO|nr:hypothetical protein CDD81_6257 [Ophiocordyceps australis]